MQTTVFLKLYFFFGNKDHYVYAVAADRKAASRLDSSLRSKHSSGLPRRPTSAKVSHTIAPTTTSTRFLSSQQQAFGYTTYYTTIRSIPLCVLCTRAGACPHHYTSSSSPPHTTTGRFVHHRHRPRVHLPHTVVHPPFLKSVVLGRVT